MSQLTMLKEFPYNPVGSWSSTNPYTIAFVYTKHGNGFVVKGGLKDVENYLESMATLGPAIIHYTFFWKNGTRRIIEPINCGKVLITKLGTRKNKRWEVSVGEIGMSPYSVVATMKKLPRKWIKELDPYVEAGEEKKDTKFWRKIVL